MPKILGYILALIGIAVIVLSNKIKDLSFLAGLGTKAIAYTVIAGIVIVALGVVFLVSTGSKKSKVEQASEEVPIYEGEGKNRKIVGYQKAGKK